MRAVIAIGIMLATVGAAIAAPLAKEESDFVAQEIGSAVVATRCAGYEMVPNAAEGIGDRVGVGDDIRTATVAAYGLTFEGAKIDRKLLIPEVTRRVNEVLGLLEQRLAEGKLCGLAPAYVKRGWIRPKGG